MWMLLPGTWLLLRYVELRPSARGLALAACLALWATANVAVLTGNTPGLPWAVPAGVALLALVAWLYVTHPRQSALA